jgi:ABC-type antimicrobial peptide transport system permease subunit
VANREFARKLFGSVTGALGRYFKLQDGRRVQVVGVVEDGKYMSVAELPHPAMFVPCLQAPATLEYFLVRSRRAPAELAGTIRAKLHELDPELPVDTGTWASCLDVALFPSRVAVVALGVLGGIGAVLSITGIFGMAAFSVSRRMKDLGIRIALGAQRGELLRITLGKPVALLAAGSAVGVALGVLSSHVLGVIVYGATPRDPLVWVGVLLVMALLGVAATWIPAQRALSVDPLRLLREE